MNKASETSSSRPKEQDSDNKDKIKKLQLWIGFAKFALGTFILGILVAVLNHQIQQQTLQAKIKEHEKEFLKGFIERALDENLEKRVRFAHYFSRLLKENWEDYYNDLKDEYKDYNNKLIEKEKQLKETLATNPGDKNRIEQLQKEVGRLQLEIQKSSGKAEAPQSSKSIEYLHPVMRQRAEEFLSKAKNSGINVRIVTTYRSIEAQDAIYAQGMTSLKGGQSAHNFGLAFDVLPFVDQTLIFIKYTQDKELWDNLARIAKDVGLSWGGQFDPGHFELPNWKTLNLESREKAQ